MTADQIGLWAGFVLTLMIFSYLLGDNVLYRLAVFIFVGLAAGFITVVTVESVLLPWIRSTLIEPETPGLRVIGALPLVLGFLLLLRTWNGLGRLGNLALAFIIGVGAAVAVVGAVSGTLLPLATSTGAALASDRLNGFILVFGVVCSLVYFQYMARRTQGGEVRQMLHVQFLGAIGKGFIVAALGALYAGAILTGLTVLSERLAFIIARIGGG